MGNQLPVRFRCRSCRFFIGTWNMSGFLNEDRPVQTLRAVLTKLQDAYCSTIGFEVHLCMMGRVALASPHPHLPPCP